MIFSTPILYLVFNRPEETAITFRQIKNLKPTRLYIAQDGPRDLTERIKTQAVTKLVQKIDWHCEVQYLIRENNLGCKEAVNSALDWFFENEEMGIIMEDDILADNSFFSFAEIMLKRYFNDMRVMLISGNNLLGEHAGDNDYFFSKVGAIWGWATWRRAWEMHDKTMEKWPEIKKDIVSSQILPEPLWKERISILDKVYNCEIDTWDYQFTLTRLINSGLSILPRKNLIENIGFNNDATHTKNKPIHIENTIMAMDVSRIQHPLVIAADMSFDYEVFARRQSKPDLLQRIKKKLYERK